MSHGVPVIDLTPYRNGTDKVRVAGQVADACRSIGFLVITGHGIPKSIVDTVIEQTRLFFELPVAAKMAVRPATPGVFRGYTALESRSLAKSLGVKTPPDLREGFTINRVQDKSDAYFHAPAAGSIFADNVWPDNTVLPNFKTAFTDYYLAMDQLTLSLMRIFALALDLSESHFDRSVDKHFSNLCAYHYPPAAVPPLPGQLRGGSHTDFGSMTLVYGVPSVKGLQVWNGEAWVDAPSVPDAFVVNIGDLMAQWTNDKWVSTLHRVANPNDSGWDKSRYSIVFFHQPNYDALIESLDKTSSPKYPPVTSGDHLRRKLSAMQLNS